MTTNLTTTAIDHQSDRRHHLQVTVIAPITNYDDIIQTIPSCNGVLHVMSGFVLPMERYNASLFTLVPSSVQQANAVLSQWNASMLQNTYTKPMVVRCCC